MIPADICTQDAPMLLDDCECCGKGIPANEGGALWNRSAVVCDRCFNELYDLRIAAMDAPRGEW